MNHLFAYRQSKPSDNAALPSLPSSWYRSEVMYSLERSDIFSKKRMLLLEGGFSFFLILDRQGKIKWVPQCLQASLAVWINGKLAKAHRYQELDGFDKEKTCLFPIHIHIDKLGLIWVNLDAAETPSPRLKPFVFSEYRFDHAWDMLVVIPFREAKVNEQVLSLTGHPGIVQYPDLGEYWVDTYAGHIQHYNTDRPDHEGMGIISTFYIATHMQYEIHSIFKQVLKEDKDPCNAAQRNLKTGLYVNGELHPQHEKEPLFFQRSVKDLVVSHHRAEEKQGKEIWPATPVSSMTSKPDEDMSLCRKIDRRAGSND
ncbi:hypothetical protein BDV11DRAFT_205274 [Aspergillus similis]